MADSVDDSTISAEARVRFSESFRRTSGSEVNNDKIADSGHRIARHRSQVYLPRLITRDYAFHQSSNVVQVFNKNKYAIRRLFLKDWFHVMLRFPGMATITILLLTWWAMIWVFAYVFLYIDSNNFNLNKDCGLGDPGEPINLSTAYAFSLETCTTVGCEFY